MGFGIWKSGFVSFGGHKVVDLSHYIICTGGDTSLNEMLPNITSSHIVGVNKIDIVVAVIAEDIDNEFISREVMHMGMGGAQLVYCLYEPCLAAVVVGNAIAYVAHWTDGE